MSLKAKLISVVAMICLVVGIMLVGIFAAETQQIKLNGQVNFEIADKSLYVKDVRMQENMDTSTIYSLKDSGRFMPGYVNETFNMNLGNFTNTYGSFALYFDVINTMDETSGETFAYTVKSSTTQSGAEVTTVILDSNGSSIDQIPQGIVKPSQITSSTPISATIKVTVRGTAGVSIDLSQITITINQVLPQVYGYFDFSINSDGTTVTLTDYDSSLSDTTDIVIPASVSKNASGQWIEGDTYTVTDILSATSYSNGVFYNSGITSIELPSTLKTIGDYSFYHCSGLTSVTLPSSLENIGGAAFSGCTGLTGNLIIPEGVTSIESAAFYACSKFKTIDFSNCTSLTKIGRAAFYECSELTNVDLSGCTSLILIEYSAFSCCYNLSGITFPYPTKWFYTLDDWATSGTPIDMSDPKLNAERLNDDYGEEYYGYYFKRNA